MILIAIVAGFGQLLASEEKLNWRIVFGRGLSSGALGVAAGATLIWYPDMDPVAMAGLAALIASFGTSGLERLFQILVGRRP
jgi:hypothetical protein